MVVGVWRDVVERLTPVPRAERHGFLALRPMREAHAGRMLRSRRFVRSNDGSRSRQPHRPSSSAEMDVGVLRIGQAHTIGRIAAQLGHGYCYRCEFLELLPMQPPREFPRNGSNNTEGYHSNGIVASLPMRNPIVIRLDEMADWYNPPDRQRRIDNRMAIAATFNTAGIRLVACSVHLENRTDGAGRARQMRTLLKALDAYAGSAPVVIGGDLNTHVGPGGHDDASEPLFALAASRGYDWAACNLAQPTTRTSTSEGTRQLDWFCVRGLKVRDPAIVPALGDDASVLSDHEPIMLALDAG